MSFAIWSLCIGAAAFGISYILKPLFVDNSDARNPFRSLVQVLGYVGIVAGVYGIILLLIQVR